MGTYAVYNVGSGEIVNRVVIDDPQAWTPPQGFAVLEETSTPLRIGGHIVDEVYTPPVDPPPTPALPAIRQVVRVGLARFTVAAGVVSTTPDSIGISAVTRISAGRYRIYHEIADPDLVLLPSPPYIRDAADVRARVTAKTSVFVEVRIVTAAGAAADVAEVILTLDKVMNS